MKLDPQFPWWIFANAAGGVISAIALAAMKPVARFITRWRASKLPDKLHAERTQQELEGVLETPQCARGGRLSVLPQPADRFSFTI